MKTLLMILLLTATSAFADEQVIAPAPNSEAYEKEVAAAIERLQQPIDDSLPIEEHNKATMQRFADVFLVADYQDKQKQAKAAEKKVIRDIEALRAKSRERGKQNILDGNIASSIEVDYKQPVTVVSKDEWVRSFILLAKHENMMEMTAEELQKQGDPRYKELLQTALDQYKFAVARAAHINSVQQAVFVEGTKLKAYVDTEMKRRNAAMDKARDIMKKGSQSISYNVHEGSASAGMFTAETDFTGHWGKPEATIIKYMRAWQRYKPFLVNHIKNARKISNVMYEITEAELKDMASDPIKYGTYYKDKVSPKHMRILQRIHDEASVMLIALESAAGDKKRKEQQEEIDSFLAGN